MRQSKYIAILPDLLQIRLFYANDFIGKHLYNFSGKKPSVFSSYINRKEAQGRKMFFHVLLTNNYIREVNRLMVSCIKVNLIILKKNSAGFSEQLQKVLSNMCAKFEPFLIHNNHWQLMSKFSQNCHLATASSSTKQIKL